MQHFQAKLPQVKRPADVSLKRQCLSKLSCELLALRVEVSRSVRNACRRKACVQKVAVVQQQQNFLHKLGPASPHPNNSIDAVPYGFTMSFSLSFVAKADLH